MDEENITNIKHVIFDESGLFDPMIVVAILARFKNVNKVTIMGDTN